MPSINYSDVPGWVQAVIIFTIIAVGITAMITLIWKAWPVVTRFVTTINSLADLPQFLITTAATLHEQDEQIAEIHHEVNYNNGSSVKDSQNRTEKELTQVKKTLARVEKGVKGLYTREEIDAKTTAISEELERTRPPIRKPRRTS